MKYRFRREQGDSGSVGWLLIGAPPTYEPLGELAVAHDVMEHRRDDDGSVEAELQAQGAAMFIRGEGGYWRSHAQSNPGWQVSGEILYLASHYDGLEVSPPPVTRSVGSPVEDWINYIDRVTLNDLMEDMHHQETYGDQLEARVQAYLRSVRGWMRIGYRKARRRYQGVNPYVLNLMFREIEDKVYGLVRPAPHFDAVVDLNIKKQKVDVYAAYPLGGKRVPWDERMAVRV